MTKVGTLESLECRPAVIDKSLPEKLFSSLKNPSKSDLNYPHNLYTKGKNKDLHSILMFPDILFYLKYVKTTSCRFDQT